MKKQPQDKQKVNDLLQKLQASYLDGKSEREQKNPRDDDDDLAFRDKLASLLGIAADPEKPKKAKKKKAPPPTPEAEEAPIQPLPEEPTEVIPEAVTAEPEAERPAETPEKVAPAEQPKPLKKAAPKKKKKPETAPVASDAPAAEELPLPEEATEEATLPTEEAVFEEISPEEPPSEEAPVKEAAPTHHPLEKVLPLPEEPSASEAEEKAEPEEAAVVQEEAPIPVEPPVQPAKKPEAPARITIAPPSAAPDFAKPLPKTAQEPDSIVIRPRTPDRPPHETIVIRPRTPEKPTVTPEVISHDTSQIPIKIGKEYVPDRRQEADPAHTADHTAMKKEQQIPPTPQAPQKEPAAPKKANAPAAKPKLPAVSLPRSKSKQPPQKQEPAPAAQAFENELLEEVLDGALQENELITEEIPADEPEEIVIPARKPSLFQRKQMQKKQQAEEKLPAIELIRQKSGLTEDDIALMFELGYENELGRLVGYANLKRLKSEHLKRVSQHSDKHYRTAFGYRGEELSGSRHKEAVTAAYVHDRGRLLVRFLLTALLTLLLFFIETPQLLGESILTLTAAYPVLLPLAGMGLFLLVCALSFRQINAGARSLLRFLPTPYTFPAILAPIVLVYDLVSLFLPGALLPANFLGAWLFLLVAVCDVLRLCDEMRALRLLFAEEPKYVLTPATPRKIKLRRGEKIVKVLNDDLGETRYQAEQSRRAVGFFRRFNRMETAARPFMILIAVMFSAATLAAFADAVYSDSALSACSTFLRVLTVAMPAGAVFSFFYPLCRANRLLSKHSCALVGEEAVEEFDGKKTLIFRDTELYSAKKYTEIAVREGDDVRNDMRLAGILFRKLGGTLADAGIPAKNRSEDPPVSIVRVQESGVEAIVDNQKHLLFGSAEFLRRGGVRVPKESADHALRRTNKIGLSYLAVDGILKLSYELEYRINERFEEVIRALAESDTAVAITGYDPNLNNEFLQRNRAEEPDPVQVLKSGRFEENLPLEAADTGALALNSAADLAFPLHAAKSISTLRRFGMRMQAIASLIGTAGVLLLTFLGRSSLIGILPLVGYQALWVAVSLIAAHSELNNDHLHLK